jgi:FAD/FMN-containing dehydrogenase
MWRYDLFQEEPTTMKRRNFCASALTLATTAALSPWRAFAETTADVPIVRGDGSHAALNAADVNELRSALRGALLLATDEGYDQARRIWSGSFDRHPALIARCAGMADVIQAVKFARAHSLLVAVRGGGHSFSGQSVCDGGLMIDLSRLRSVHVDPTARIARIEPGVLLGELDREAQFFGLVTTAGTVSHTGAAGLTLGGGFGRLARKFGLACDNLIAAELIAPDGRLVQTSERENSDLLWGLRGGGGNFGVVTSFEYRLHPLATTVFGGSLVFPIARGREVLRFLSEFAPVAPDDLWINTSLYSMPDMGGVVEFDVTYCGPRSDAERVVAPLRKLGKPLQGELGPINYLKQQTQYDEFAHAGIGIYQRSGFIRRLEPSMIEAIVSRIEAPHPEGAELEIIHHGGAIGRVKQDATAFWHRESLHNVLVNATWEDPKNAAAREAHMTWARETWRAIEPLTEGFYVNELSAEDPQVRVRANYGGNYPRLVTLKNQYDPTNLLRMNANIVPTA